MAIVTATPPEDGGGRDQAIGFKGIKRANAAHRATTDPDAPLFKKAAGKEARLAFIGHALTETRAGLVVEGRLPRPAGDAEPAAALDRAQAHLGAGARLGADKGDDARAFVEGLREIGVNSPCGAKGPRLGDRRPHRAPFPLRRQPAGAQADRRGAGWTKTAAVAARPAIAVSTGSNEPICSAWPPALRPGRQSASPHDPFKRKGRRKRETIAA